MRIAIIGLGYVGLPVALGMARHFPHVVGFDIDKRRIAALTAGEDWTGETDAASLKQSPIKFTADESALKGADIFIVCVPTPIHADRRPDLGPLNSSSRTVGRAMKKGAIVCYESTVYPGVTEEYCGPILAEVSGLTQGRDFKLGYSPERINPGDREHTFEKIKKVVAGEDAETTRILGEIYSAAVTAGVHLAPSIKVGEAAKVLENTQRDLNIALMNELAVICGLMDIRTKDVLAAAGTKWNFLKFSPGLVGGHCIGVDPYYLTSKAQELGYHPEVILAGRKINDSMGVYIANRAIRCLGEGDKPLRQARVGILGLTFKEDVPDIRNSRVPDIIKELKTFGITPLICDPHVNPDELAHEYGLSLNGQEEFQGLDALILAVPHKSFLTDKDRLSAMLNPGGVILDVKSVLEPSLIPATLRYWSL
ncbi:MAG: nucleotide sugar dehydrogenase [Alphaproteobacteria bacterium]|nr:nucleotide sugar dehydrogenase [Alphaproteobacteria bacterium]